MLKARLGKEVVLRVENEVGVLDQIARTVAEKGVDVVAACAWVEGPLAVVHLVTDDNRRVVDALRSTGWSIPDPQGNFVWLPVTDLAADLGVALERNGVVARAFPDVGVRVTIADAPSNDRFIAALEAAATDLGAEPR